MSNELTQDIPREPATRSGDPVQRRAAGVRLALFDVDGVLTDGRITLGDDGQEYKSFNVRDGHGLKMLMSAGIEVGVLTGRRSRVVAHRMAELGIHEVIQGQSDKRAAFEALLARRGLAAEAVAYTGDDVVDLPILRRVGLAVAVADAHPLVRRHAHWITSHPGGHGAVRELCEAILEAHGRLEAVLDRYLV